MQDFNVEILRPPSSVTLRKTQRTGCSSDRELAGVAPASCRPAFLSYVKATASPVNQLSTFFRATLHAALCSLLSGTTVITAPLLPSATEARLKLGE